MCEIRAFLRYLLMYCMGLAGEEEGPGESTRAYQEGGIHTWYSVPRKFARRNANVDSPNGKQLDT